MRGILSIFLCFIENHCHICHFASLSQINLAEWWKMEMVFTSIIFI